MSFLIAMGTTAAYSYSVAVVIYNAVNLGSGKPRLMQSFESSSLLISFVLLGKYLEASAKSKTSKAVSALAEMAPDSATLVGTVDISGKVQTSTERIIPLALLQKRDVLLVRPGEKVILVDDLIATGGTAEGAVKLLRQIGAEIVAACFIIDLPDLGGRTKLEALGVPVRTLIEYQGH